jgi:serine/threonine protein kinase
MCDPGSLSWKRQHVYVPRYRHHRNGARLDDIFVRTSKDELLSMSAQPRQIIEAEAWQQWENRVVNDVFPLRRFLGGSDHSAVFLSEYKAKNLPEVAIKFMPADALEAKAQLAQWRAAAKHPHPNLVRMFAVGRCQSGGSEFIFVVMEYAEQTLAQLLLERAMSAEEALELLSPTLDALAFLHGSHLVHGHVKPANFVVVNDRLKLASDTIRPLGNIAGSGGKTSLYDPPELKDRGHSPAGDIWALGMTLVEALTQRLPAWPDGQRESAPLPSSFPASFVDTVRRCLSIAPANRPAAIKLAAHYKALPAKPDKPAAVEPATPVPPAPPIADVKPVVQEAPPKPPVKQAPPKATPAPSAPKKKRLLPVMAAAVVIAVAIGAALQFSDIQQAQLQTPAPTPPVAAATVAKVVEPPQPAPSMVPESVANSQDQSSTPADAASSSVLHEVVPDVPQAALDKIKGHIYVSVRVLVDPAGDVFGQLVENAGTSKHFARLAEDAAGEWKFVPADSKGARVWLVRFDFNRDGIITRATAM